MTEDDSNDEKSGTEVGSCVKGSQIRKAVPPPEDKILLEPLRGVLSVSSVEYSSEVQQDTTQLHPLNRLFQDNQGKPVPER